MANRTLVWFLFAIAVAVGLIVAFGQTPTPTPPPSGGVFPINNGKLLSPLDANQQKIVNAPAPTGPNDYATKDYVDTHGGGGGGGGGGLSSITGDNGASTGLTLAITGNTNVLTDPVFTLGATLNLAHGGTGATNAGTARTNLGLGNVDNTSDLNKPISTATQSALDLKASITYVDTGLAGKATPANITSALNAFTGTTNITTLGTIGTGTWQGTAIGSTYLPSLSGLNAPTTDVFLGSKKITSLADPTASTDAANKQYVDSVAVTGPPHPAVAVATTANITRSGEQTIDGILTSASRILVKNQTTAADNGIYVTAAGAWTRAADANTGATVSGSVFVSAGTVNAGTTWGVTTPQPITLGTTAIAYTQTGANTVYSAGTGLQLTGSTFSTSVSAPSKLMGRYSTGAGASQEISIGSGLSLNTSTGVLSSTATGSITGITAGNLATLAGSPSTLFQTAVDSTTTPGVPALSFSMTASNPNTFFGNNGSGTGFMIASDARTSLGGTTVGQNLFTLTNTNGGVVTFPKLNADNSVTRENAATYLGSIGAAPAFTASSPLSLSVANVLSIATASTTLTGALTSTDWNTFNAKVPGGRTLTTTAPLRISTSTTPISGPPGSDLSANRTIDMPAATNTVDGYMTAADHITFAAKTGPDSEVTLTNSGGLTGSPATWTSGATAARETQALTVDRYVTLPPASAYNPGKRIVYTDNVTTGNVGRWFRPNGTDKLNGGTADVRAFIAGIQGAYGNKAVDLECVGGASPGWQMVSASTVFHVEDPVDAGKQFTFNAGLQIGSPAPSPGTVTAARGNSVTVSPTSTALSTPVPKNVVTNIDENGVATARQLTPTDLHPVEFIVPPAPAQFGDDVAANSVFTVSPDDGTINLIRIVGNLLGPITIRWPHAANYESGSPVSVIDAYGSVGASHPVTITSFGAGTDTFSGQGSFIIDEKNAVKALVSNGASDWTVATTKTSIQPFSVLPGPNKTYTISGAQSAVKHNGHINLQNGQNFLFVTSPYDGMSIELVLVQPASGVAGVLNLPAVSSVANTGNGKVTLTATNGAVDRIRGVYDASAGAAGMFLWDPPITAHTTDALPTWGTPTITATPFSAQRIDLAWTDATGETFYQVERADGLSQTTGFTAVGSAKAAGTTAHSDTTVTAGASYTYRVQACDSAGCTASSTVNASAAAGAPAPDLLGWTLNEGGTTLLTDGTGTTVNGNLSQPFWLASGSTMTGIGSALAAAKGLPATVVTPTAIGGGTGVTWSYRVLAWKHNAAAALVHNGATTVTIVNGNTLSGTVKNQLSWPSITGAEYYRVYRVSMPSAVAPLTTGNIAEIAQVGGTITYTDDGSAVGDNVTVSGTSTDLTKVTGAAAIVYPTTGTTGQVVSMSVWVNAAGGAFNVAPDATAAILNLGLTANNQKFDIIAGSKFRVTMAGTTGSIVATVSNTAIQTGWHHVVVIMDNSTVGNTTTNSASDNVRVYFDKVQQTLTYTTTDRVGPKQFPNDLPFIGNAVNFNGWYDDFRMYSGALGAGPHGELTAGTGSQIEALFNNQAQ